MSLEWFRFIVSRLVEELELVALIQDDMVLTNSGEDNQLDKVFGTAFTFVDSVRMNCGRRCCATMYALIPSHVSVGPGVRDSHTSHIRIYPPPTPPYRVPRSRNPSADSRPTKDPKIQITPALSRQPLGRGIFYTNLRAASSSAVFLHSIVSPSEPLQ